MTALIKYSATKKKSWTRRSIQIAESFCSVHFHEPPKVDSPEWIVLPSATWKREPSRTNRFTKMNQKFQRYMSERRLSKMNRFTRTNIWISVKGLESYQTNVFGANLHLLEANEVRLTPTFLYPRKHSTKPNTVKENRTWTMLNIGSLATRKYSLIWKLGRTLLL